MCYSEIREKKISLNVINIRAKWCPEPAALGEIKGLELTTEIFIFERNSPSGVA